MVDGIKVYFKSSDEVRKDTLIWANEISKVYSPDLIVFIAKSGFLYAKFFQEYFKCEMVDVIASRPDNKYMDIIKKTVPFVPKWLLSLYLRRKVSASHYSDKAERIVQGTIRFEQLNFEKYNNILLIDDSVDTGWSLLKVQEYLYHKGIEKKVKTASYCVLSESLNRVNVDFYRLKDSIVITSTSRYSREHRKFLTDYERWKLNVDRVGG